MYKLILYKLLMVIFTGILVIGFLIYLKPVVIHHKLVDNYNNVVLEAKKNNIIYDKIDYKSPITDSDYENLYLDYQIQLQKKFLDVKYNQILDIISKYDDSNISFSLIDLNTELVYGYNDQTMLDANYLKPLIVLLTYADKIENKDLSLDTRIIYSPSKHNSNESGEIKYLKNFESALVSELVTYMINYDDHIAFNMLYTFPSKIEYVEFLDPIVGEEYIYQDDNLLLSTNQILKLYEYIYSNLDNENINLINQMLVNKKMDQYSKKSLDESILFIKDTNTYQISGITYGLNPYAFVIDVDSPIISENIGITSEIYNVISKKQTIEDIDE